MPSNDVFTRNDDGDLAVRTVSAIESSTVVNPNDVYTRDTDGNLCIRTVGGGDSHNKGYFATPEALRTAYPTAEAGDFAIVESTDTVWVWDSDTSAWKDSDQKGQVTSVNNQTGDVTLTASDVGALASGDNVSSLVNDAGYLTQHQSIKTVNNTSLVGTGNVDVQETLVSGTNIKTINDTSVLGSGNIAVQETLVSGTNIKTINNQSVLGSGNLTVGGGGINWTAHFDKLADNQYYIHAAFCTNQRLPVGNYEMYIKRRRTTNGVLQTGWYIYKVLFRIYDDGYGNIYCDGSLNPVLDGDMTIRESDPMVNLYNDDMPWMLNLHRGLDPNYEYDYFVGGVINDVYCDWGLSQTAVDNFIMCSNIVNTDTKVEYPVTIKIDYNDSDNTYPGSDYSDIGSMWVDKPVTVPKVDSMFEGGYSFNNTNPAALVDGIYNAFNVDNPNYNPYNTYGFNIAMGTRDKNSVYDADVYFSLLGAYYKINKATGIFADTIICSNNSEPYNTFIKFNYPANTNESGYVCVASLSNKQFIGKTYPINMMSDDNGLTEYARLNVGSTVKPETIDKIEQYTGTTDANYTNGYFYKACGTLVNVPTTLDFLNTPTGTTISIADVDNFLTAFATTIGWDDVNNLKAYITEYGYTNFSFVCQDGVLASFEWSGGGGTITDNNLLGYFTLITDQTTGEFNFTGDCQITDAYKEVQNGYWERVDVQPTPTASDIGAVTQTTTTVTLASSDWSSHTQTKTVSGVTATNTVIVAPVATSASDYAEAEILCTAQGTNSLTFTCTTDPTNNVSINVVILN